MNDGDGRTAKNIASLSGGIPEQRLGNQNVADMTNRRTGCTLSVMEQAGSVC